MEVITRQISGLGNQLFQYAAGLYIARRYNASLRMAVDAVQVSHGKYPRPFLLSHFQIPIPMLPLTPAERMLFSPRKTIRPFAELYRRARGIQIFNEPAAQRHTFIQDVTLQHSTRLLYLFGYWQVYGMVDAVTAELRRDLQLRAQPSGRNLELMEQIGDRPNAVSLHMRRGDYTLAAEGNRALPLSYYNAALVHFRERLERPTFFVFSDDIAFAKANLPQDCVFVDHNDEASPHEDLRLMSACRHHIIANSSLSWWGAWLNPSLAKMVYAPKYWMMSDDSYYPELFPAGWTLDAVNSLRQKTA